MILSRWWHSLFPTLIPITEDELESPACPQALPIPQAELSSEGLSLPTKPVKFGEGDHLPKCVDTNTGNKKIQKIR